jgi:hypothetical protein
VEVGLIGLIHHMFLEINLIFTLSIKGKKSIIKMLMGKPIIPKKNTQNLPKKVKEKIKENSGWDVDNPPGKTEESSSSPGNAIDSNATTTITVGVIAIVVAKAIMWVISGGMTPAPAS